MINKIYFDEKVLEKAKLDFSLREPKLIMFDNFLDADFAKKLFVSLSNSQQSKVFVPDKESFSRITFTEELNDLMHSESLQNILETVTNRKVSSINFGAQLFAHKDYSVIHEENLNQSRLEFFLVLTKDDWNHEAGGFSSYSQGDGEPIIFPVINNSLAIIETDDNTFDFVKYIKNFAGDNYLIKIKGLINSE